MNFEAQRRMLKLANTKAMNKKLSCKAKHAKQAEDKTQLVLHKLSSLISDIIVSPDPNIRSGAAQSPYFIPMLKLASIYNEGKAEQTHTTTKQVNPKQLKMGIKVEREHLRSKKARKEIALDHLAEDPKYYSKLKKVESK